MNSLIFRFAAPYLTSLLLLFSFFVTLRGHNEVGGGFIGGLIAASAIAIYGIACGVGPVRRAIRFHPLSMAGAGLLIAALAGCVSIAAGTPFLTGLWWFPPFLDGVGISTPLFFDIGVYLVVAGTFASIALALEESDGT